MSTVTLSAVKTGMTRLRTKGGASPSSLFELTNAYVTAAKTIVPRPGSDVFQTLPYDTVGLSLVNGVFQIFADNDPGSPPAGFNINVLTPPEDADTATLVRIWLAAPLMGGLYVVAEWSNDPTVGIHYWIRGATAGEWQADHVYMLGDIVKTTTGGALAYEAGRANPADKVWAQGIDVQVGDVVEPPIFNGYRYRAKEIYGDPARTGKVEPTWIAETGATVIEDADVKAGTTSTGGTAPPTPGYSNPGGGTPPGYKFGEITP